MIGRVMEVVEGVDAAKPQGDSVSHAVIRSYSAGVFAGEVVNVEPSGPGRQRVTLDGSRRLWRWTARDGVALSGVAAHGLKLADSKVDSPINGHVVDDVIEIIPTSVAAQETLR